MKRLFSIFILSLVLLHFAGFYVYFIVRLQTIHTEARAALRKLPKAELTLIILTSNQYQEAKEGDDEIEWEDKMYDIAFVESLGDIIQVYARHDEAEDNLLSFIKKVINRAQEDTQSTPTALHDFFSLVYVEPTMWKAPLLTDSINRQRHNFYTLDFRSIKLLIDSPPPRS